MIVQGFYKMPLQQLHVAQVQTSITKTETGFNLGKIFTFHWVLFVKRKFIQVHVF
jgi:hypothetical protein